MGPELLLLILALIVVLVWRGPSTLPRLGEAAGKAVKNVRQGMASRSDGKGSGTNGTDGPDTGAQP